mmetsp:Transcript_31984/g.67236  ORF Transcript_31984/g.67236 Transcript_31984/m.67236 type:complete len:85 (+) Transcript_31984:28-282(+)|eukprot:CAMPEP_0172320552 /NCGR_PEP_ID=MMETSP1058-20130122/40799_1 /TAXON_ID=83371 /ORGANISM="Detonula confervacea, Strain CCMP 353" /LENGTH=84 /DNA_ID=CAMNT_0013035841 /DNA_START=32 /DNA_END=286 /DNA_ORIENTATION=-
MTGITLNNTVNELMEDLGATTENNTTLQNEDSTGNRSSSDDSSQTAGIEFGPFLGTPNLVEVRKELLGKKPSLFCTQSCHIQLV